MSEFVPEGWGFERIDSLLSQRIRDFGSFSTTKLITFLDNGVPFIKSESVQQGTINFKTVSFISEEVHAILEKSYVNPGDILFTKIGAIGRAALYKGELGVCNSNAATAKITVDGEKANSQYVTYQLVSERVTREFEKSIVSTPPRINLGDINSMKIELPPLPEQQKIAAILTSVDDVIEKTQAQINKLKDLKTGMMQELLTCGVGVDGKPHTEFKDSPVGRIPKAWDVRGIYDVCNEIFLGLTAKVDYTESDGAYLIRATDISNGVLSFSKARQITHSQHQSLTKKRQAKRGDVLVSKSGSLGVCALVDTDVEFSIYESIIVLQPEDRVIDSKYLLWLMRATETQTRLLGGVVGSTVGHLNLGDFRKLKVPIPKFEEQVKLGRVFESLNQKFTSVENRLLQYKSIKKALMQDLLTGKVRVKVND